MKKERKWKPEIGKIYGNFKIIDDLVELTKDNKVKFHVKCSCNKTQFVSAYFLESGRQNCCKECSSRNAYNTSKINNKRLGFIKLNHEGIGNFTKTAFWYIKNCAKKRNIYWDKEITIEYLWNLLEKQNFKCFYTKLPIKLTEERKKNNVNFSKMTASLDRIDSKKGYTKDNIQWVHKTINLMKNNLLEKDFKNFCKLVYLNDNQQPSSQSEKVQRLPE